MSGLWSSLTNAWRGCVEEAWSAYRAGSLPIGSVVVDSSGETVSRGRNRIHETSGEPKTLFGHKLSHAEMNALVTFDYSTHDVSTSTLFTTTEPCPLCVGAARMSGVGALSFAARDPWAGSSAMFEKDPYLRRGSVVVSGPEDTLLEDVLVAVQIEYWLRTRPRIVEDFVSTYETTLPRATRAGRSLHTDDILGQLASSDEDAETVTEIVARRVLSI